MADAGPPLLSVRDLRVQFGGAEVVRGVDFDVRQGETVGIVGESGSGKSVTALSIVQLLPYPHARHRTGSIRFAGTELVGAGPAQIRAVRGNRIGMVFQEPMSSLNPLLTIGEQIVEVLRVHRRIDRRAARARALELLELVEIPEARRRLNAYPFELSGGQAQRAMIAIALANEPDLLIADEPTTALDVTVQAQVLGLIAGLQKRFGMALLLITHDLQVVEKMAHRVCVMYDGRIVEHGPVAEVLRTPRHGYTRMLLDARPSGGPATVAKDAPIVVQARGVDVRFPIRTGLFRRVTGYLHAVRNVDLAVRRGQTVAVVGESGSGKTTLGRALLRLQPSGGQIVFGGRSVESLSRQAMRPLRRQMQIVFQDPIGALSPRLRVSEIVGEGLRIHRLGTPSERDRTVAQALEEVGIDPQTRHRYPHEFSGGQRQRIAIARVLVLRPSFIVMDEPTSALDRSVQAQIVDLLRDLQARHALAYLFISHDLSVVRAIADQVLVMKQGVVVEQGSAKDIFSAPRHTYTRALFKAAFDLEAARSGGPASSEAGSAPGPATAPNTPTPVGRP
ncbi:MULTISPECIES: ABC transporter ATP-binding protein [unclassified Roseitalea]|uniref:ABC transporter ATP-binding protein n=1 Tax=unclassified Roseitalea TaxID=2639107 RepID=UPI00273D6A32|nr:MULTISPECIES: ABC transporter ATP-binding protein [unclassified Roseitalea]